MRHRLLAIALLLVTPHLLAAQTDPLTIRMAPAPNQTLHLRNTQDMTMTTEPDHAVPDSPIPAMTMVMHTVIDSTSAVGPTDSDGRYSAATTIDHITATMTMNGKPMPSPMPTGEAAKPVITLSYDNQGQLVDIATEGSQAAVNDMLKQIMKQAFATVAPMTLSVGETVTVPTALNLPLPAGSPMMPLGVKAETRYTLTSVTFDGADRVAHLTSHTTTTMNQASPSPGGAPFTLDLTMTGDGKMDVNVDRGIVPHSEQQATLEVAMNIGTAAGRALPRMKMHGIFTNANDLVK